MPAVTTGSETELRACPCCGGVTGFLEEHRDGFGGFFIARHFCRVCKNVGLVERDRARAWWLTRPPTA